MSAAAPSPGEPVSGEPVWVLADRLVLADGEPDIEWVRELVEAHCRVTGGEFSEVLLEVMLELAARVALNHRVLRSGRPLGARPSGTASGGRSVPSGGGSS